MKKMNLVKTIGLVGTALGVVSTVISNWSQQKDIERTIEEKVDIALNGEYIAEESE